MSNVRLALQTLRNFEEMVHRDGGAAYRGWLGRVLPHIGDAYRTEEESHRTHLGASIMGGECARAIYMSHRWCTKGQFSGRILRLFNRGHLEEGRFIALLLTIGCHVWQQDENGKQFRISGSDGHFGGSGDGIIGSLPDLDHNQVALGEFKTHNEKSFHKLAGKNWNKYVDWLVGREKDAQKFEGEGVRKAKFEHYVQMQIYMRKMGLSVALYVAVDKNSDGIYAELVPLDTEIADQFIERADKIVWLQKAPRRIATSASDWRCMWCDHKPVCYGKAAPDRNCRTCIFSSPQPGGNGRWACSQPDVRCDDLSAALQYTGCAHYVARSDFSAD